MARLVHPLRRAGARIDGDSTLPLTVQGARLAPIDHLNLPPSAQVKSALLLAALAAGVRARIVEPLASRDHGERMLAEMGARISLFDSPDGRTIDFDGHARIQGTTIAIPGDPSSGAFLAVAAAIVPGSRIALKNVMLNPLRGGIFRTLQAMGTAIDTSHERRVSSEAIGDVMVVHRPLTACRVEAPEIPAMIDEIPALAIACALANGTSTIGGLGELRHKESDRLAAIVSGLRACGIDASSESEMLRIVGRPSVDGGRTLPTGGDHRMAMAFSILGLAANEAITVDGGEMVATSYPGFAHDLRSLGADIREIA